MVRASRLAAIAAAFAMTLFTFGPISMSSGATAHSVSARSAAPTVLKALLNTGAVIGHALARVSLR